MNFFHSKHDIFIEESNMNEKAFKAYKNKILAISQKAQLPDKQGKRRTKVISSEGVVFALLDETVDEYNELTKKLLREKNWSEKFSEKYIEEALHSIIARVIQSHEKQKDTNDLLENLINNLVNYNREWIVLVPLSGIVMQLDSIQLGKVTIYTITKERAEELLAKIETIILSTRHTDKEKQQMVQIEREHFLRGIQNNVCAEFRVIAEPGRARERAEEETRRVLDILRYSIPSLYPDNCRISVSLLGEIISTSRWIPIISSDSKSFSESSRLIGPLVPFELGDSNIKQMEEIGAFKLSDIIAKPEKQLTDFEKTLLRALHWFSSSLTQHEIENQLLNMITCLETLLTPRGSNPIGTAIAEGVAILIRTGVENRIILKKKVQEIYRLRSAISHGGKKEIFESDVKELREISKTLIKTMIKRKDEFKSQKELLDWIEKQKLG